MDEQQLWILAVSKDIDTMKRYLTNFLKEAEQETEETTFEFEKDELTLKILGQATPGWIIEPLKTPCTIPQRQVESRMQPHNIERGPTVCEVRIAFEKPSKPPDEVLRNRIRLEGIKPDLCFNIYFNPPLPSTDDPPALDCVIPIQEDFYRMVIFKIPAKWKTFGTMLGIDIERLEGIHLDKKSPEDCFLDVYRIGKMEFDQKFTWRRVLDILHVLKENRLRKEIQDSLVGVA